MTLELTENNFEAEVLKSDKPVMVDFWAPWCGPCLAMAPILEELSKEVEGKYKVAKLNVDENNALASQYGIMSIPTLKIFKEGQIVREFIGLQAKDTLKEALDNLQQIL